MPRLSKRAKSTRLDRATSWDAMMRKQNNSRAAMADPAWALPRKRPSPQERSVSLSMPMGARRCVGTPSMCSCRACVLARWEAQPTTSTTRAGIRIDDGSEPSSTSSQQDSGADGEQEESGRSEGVGAVPRGRSLSASAHQRGFRGFAFVKAVDHFCPLGSAGPAITVEAHDLPTGCTEQTLLVDDFKMSVLEQISPLPRSMPETLVTVSRRTRDSVGGTAHYEVLFSSRSLTRERAISVDHLADAYDQRRHESEHSDAIGVAALLESTARTYGTTAAELVDALCRVVPRQIGLSLDALTVH